MHRDVPRRKTRDVRRFGAAIVVAAAVMGLPVTALARQATTAPGSVALIRVVIADGKIVMTPGARAPRGAAALFKFTNKTESTVRFALLGRVSKPIAPHGNGGLVVYLLRRGVFVVTVRLSQSHELKESFIVY
jgi:hypothetical protein